MSELGDGTGSAVMDDCEAATFTDQELILGIKRPHLAIEYIFGQRDRLMATVEKGGKLGMLVVLLLFIGLLFSFPFSALPPVAGPLNLSDLFKCFLLFTGSMLISFPSLHIFSKYVGIELSQSQNLVIALVVSGTASIICFGFFPVLWFIDLTTGKSIGSVRATEFISNFLLAAALLLGAIHSARCFFWSDRFSAASATSRLVFLLWFALLAFLTFRMAQFLKIV